MFRNRWGALFFVVMSAVGAATLIGREEDKGVLLNAAEDIRQQKAAMQATMSDLSPPPVAIPSQEAIAFTSDEELIDDASGIDPTPIEDAQPLAPEETTRDEVVIVSRDVASAGPE